MASRERVNQLGIDAKPISRTLNAALQNVSHTQLLSDLAGRHWLALICECRVSGDDEQTGNLRQIGDQAVCHSVDKMLRPRFAGHVGERHDRNGRPVKGNSIRALEANSTGGARELLQKTTLPTASTRAAAAIESQSHE